MKRGLVIVLSVVVLILLVIGSVVAWKVSVFNNYDDWKKVACEKCKGKYASFGGKGSATCSKEPIVDRVSYVETNADCGVKKKVPIRTSKPVMDFKKSMDDKSYREAFIKAIVDLANGRISEFPQYLNYQNGNTGLTPKKGENSIWSKIF